MNRFSKYPEWLETKGVLPLAKVLSKEVYPTTIKEAADLLMEYQLNADQMAAVQAVNGFTVINAGAGTGKSMCLTARLVYIRQRYPAANVLLISFTKKAANELVNRIKDTRHCQVCTFHSLFWRILRSNGFADFEIVFNEASRNKAIERIIGKANTTTAQILRSLSNPGQADQETTAVMKKYFNYLRKNKLMDFDAMQLFCLELLQQNVSVLNRLQSVFNFIMVDEYQDIDSVQAEIIRLLAAKHNNLCVVGDGRQSIYGFRGSVATAMRDFTKQYPQAKGYDLKLNYRCNPAILGLANKIMPDYSELVAVNADGCIYPQYMAAATDVAEAKEVLAEIKKLRKAGYAYKDIAILYRSAAVSSALLGHLLDQNIPAVSSKAGSNLYTQRPYNGIVALLRYATHPQDMGLFKAILPILYLKQAWLSYIRKQTKEEPQLSLMEIAKNIPGLPPFHLEYIERIQAGLIDIAEQPVDVAIHRLLSAGYAKYIGAANVAAVEELAKVSKAYVSVQEFLLHIDDVTAKFQTMKQLAATPNADYIRLMTIHASKGMEFKAVFLIGAYDGGLPNTQHDDIDLEEEKRLLYVAVTRAKERLYISYPLQDEKNIEPNQVSRFLREAFFIYTNKN